VGVAPRLFFNVIFSDMDGISVEARKKVLCISTDWPQKCPGANISGTFKMTTSSVRPTNPHGKANYRRTEEQADA
jgi:hypothetical protein